MKRVMLGFLLVTLLLGFGGAAYAEPLSPVNNSAIVFQNVLPALQKTGVPLKIPVYVPGPKEYDFVATIISADKNGYEVVIGDQLPCNGGNACRLGTVAATRLKPDMLSPEKAYAAMFSNPKYQPRRSPEKPSSVQLEGGITGFFAPYVCGANCNDSKVIWDQGGFRYYVGIKEGDKESLVKMANSAITGK